MQIKCENCVYYKTKPEHATHLPNDRVCTNIRSKWFGYWPPTGECEKYLEKTRKTVQETLDDDMILTMKKFNKIFCEIFNIDRADDNFDDFLKQDSAIIRVREDLK